MKRFAQRAAWGIADFLTQCPQTSGVIWWTAALLRFASTGETLTVTPMPVERWEADCQKWRGRVLTGAYAHWCFEWDELPVDETCREWPCGCFPTEIR